MIVNLNRDVKLDADAMTKKDFNENCPEIPGF